MQENRVHPWYLTWWGMIIVFVAAIIGIFIVASGIYIYKTVRDIQSGKIQNPNSIDLTSKPKTEVSIADNYWIGTDKPKVTIIEFADFTCPYCEASFPTIRELSVKYKDTVKVVYKDFPLRQEYSIDLALGARCAGEQGLFWPMHDKLFQNQGTSKPEEIAALAKQIGADINRFADCFNNKKYMPQVQRDILEGQDLKISGTPTFFVNGYRLEGDVPMQTWEAIINKFINNPIN